MFALIEWEEGERDDNRFLMEGIEMIGEAWSMWKDSKEWREEEVGMVKIDGGDNDKDSNSDVQGMSGSIVTRRRDSK